MKRHASLVGVVGPCGAGKSLLVVALRHRGVRVREIAQEHSYVPAMWQHITDPDWLIYLDVSREVAARRKEREMPVAYWNRLLARLAHALAHADLVVDTDGLTPEDVLQQVLQFVESKA